MELLVLFGLLGGLTYLVHKSVSNSNQPQRSGDVRASGKASGNEKRIYLKSDAEKQSGQNNGEVIIPDEFEAIAYGAFDKNERVTSITVPGSVKEIDARAFAECKNLKEVDLAEGLIKVDTNIFSGCESLEEVVIPDSVSDLYGWTFYDFTGLKKPVYSRSGDVFYCYPCTAREKVFKVPDSVKRINSAAFIGNPYIEEVMIPAGVEALGKNTFLECGALKKVTILGENTSVKRGAFYGSPDSLEIVMPKKLRYDERLHLLGKIFLFTAGPSVPDVDYRSYKRFEELAEKCSRGGAADMWNMGNYFSGLGDDKFYVCAANFWRYRAAFKGCAAAVEWLENWQMNNPGKRMPAVLNEFLVGFVSGKTLRRAGFLFFAESIDYNIDPPDENGIVTVSSYVGEEGPDEDGFGRESLFDWWFLDENLNQIKETRAVRELSVRDCGYSAIYREEYNKAREALNRKG